jgi:ATP-dependent helicase HrpB
MKLPIDALLPQVLQSLEHHPNLIIEASPGSGKTTRVPPALLHASFHSTSSQILVLEPRRLAAQQSARRIAEEMNSPVGEQVGYQFRYENKSSSKTQIKFLTEGMFLRLLPHHPNLSGVSAVILDEFHERHLHSDVALGYLKWLQHTHRPDLRIIIMSATLDSTSLSTYLGNAPVLKLQAQRHPIEIHHLPAPSAQRLEFLVQSFVLRALQETSGDVLVFLPGRAEILRCQALLTNLGKVRVCTLSGDLSKESQDEALKPLSVRKVILSTNIAETSVTIPSVTAVIDSGLHRRASYSWWSGIPALKTRPISRASAVQRMGRAGRTQAGVCYRLYTKGDFETRPAFEAPEIMRSDLSQTLLELKATNVKLASFPWYEPPPESSLQASLGLLHRLGATLGEEQGLTDLGKAMVKLPAHPRVSRFLIEAQNQGCLQEGSWLAAALIEGRLDAGNLLEQLPQYSRDESLRRTQSALFEALSKRGLTQNQRNNSMKSATALAFSVLMGFSDRVAQARKPTPERPRMKDDELELVLSAGGSAQLKSTEALEEKGFFLLMDLQENQAQHQKKATLKVRSWIPIQEDWLLEVKPQGVEEVEKCVWDAKKQRCVHLSQLVYGELILSEDSSSPRHPQEGIELLIKNTLKLSPETASLEEWSSSLSQLLDSTKTQMLGSAFTRALLFQKHMGREELPFWERLRPFLEGIYSLSEFRDLDWPFLILEALVGEEAREMDRLLPTHLQLPSGRRTPVHYSLTQEPWIQSKLQDFIGMKKTPELLQGKLRVLVHLLAPNHRPVQVTSDLESFWKNHYPQLRPSLSRRYPKHVWPEA